MPATRDRAAPPGWYADPGGARAWRVWNGRDWTAVTRPFGDRATPDADLAAAMALHRLARLGVVAFFAGLGLLVSTLAHWPGTAAPAPAWFATAASDLAVALLVLASVLYALAVRALRGRLLLAAVPGLNVLYASALVATRLGGPTLAARRALDEAVTLGLFVAGAHVTPWLALAPALVALEQAANLGELQERLIGPARVDT